MVRGPPTLVQKLRVRWLFLKAATSSFILLILGRGIKSKPAGKRFLYGLLRYLLDHATVEDDYVLSHPGTEGRYLDYAKKAGFTPDTMQLEHGAKALWFGPRDAERIFVYFHGGGYALGATDGQLKWIHRWTQNLSKKKSTATVMLKYTLSGEGVFPLQLRQAASLVDWLLTKGGKRPEQIIIGGDSAGGNMTMAIISHILHPHPDVSPKLKPSGPFAGALLISPWVNFTKEDPVFFANIENDIIGQHVGSRWGPGYRGGITTQDNYIEPVHAETTWLKGIDRVVSHIWVWAGSAEVLLGSITDFTTQLEKIHPKVDFFVEEDAIHTQMFVDGGYIKIEESVGTRQIETWLSSV